MFRSLTHLEREVSELTLADLRSDSKGNEGYLLNFATTDERKIAWISAELLENFFKSFQERENQRRAGGMTHAPEEVPAPAPLNPPAEVDTPMPNRPIKVEVPDPVEETPKEVPVPQASSRVEVTTMEPNRPVEVEVPNTEKKGEDTSAEEEEKEEEETQENPPQENHGSRIKSGVRKHVRFQSTGRARSTERSKPTERSRSTERSRPTVSTLNENSNMTERKGVVTRSRAKAEKIKLLKGLNI